MEFLDPRLFYQLVRAFIREDSSSSETERTRQNMGWFSDNYANVKRVCERSQLDFIGVIWDHYYQHKTAPSRAMMDNLIRQRDKHAPLLEILTDYDSHAETMSKWEVGDLPAVYEQRATDWEKAKVNAVFQKALLINAEGVQGVTKKDKDMRGSKDAIVYVMDQFQKGLLASDQRARGGSIKEKWTDIVDNYQLTKTESQDNKLMIPTELPEIDNILGGLRRRNLIPILGYTGQQKSTLARTLAYRAALLGYRVLHIPLELSADEEMQIYGGMHAHHPKFQHYNIKPNTRDIELGCLAPREEQFVLEVTLPDLANLPGDLIVRQPSDMSWPSIRSLIEMENRVGPLDICIVDHLGLINIGDSRDPKTAINQIVIEMKQMCLTFDENRGLTMIIPTQSNRAGFDKACENEGNYEKTAVGNYSEVERSADVMLTVWRSDEIAAMNGIKIGCCKNRRGPNIPAMHFKHDPMSGLISSEGLVKTAVNFSSAEVDPDDDARSKFFSMEY